MDAARKDNSVLLDISCPRVKAAGNTADKAERVQAEAAAAGRAIAVVVISGSEINTRRPGKVNWRREKKSQTSISKELDRITRKPGCARIPIFILKSADDVTTKSGSTLVGDGLA